MEQAALGLGLAGSTTYRLIARGDLPAVRLGSGPRPRLRVREDDLEQLLTSGTPDRRQDVDDTEPEPVREALDALREITPAWLDDRPYVEANEEVEERMRTLRLAVAAAASLDERGIEEPTPAEVRAEMRNLALNFVLHPQALLELAQGAREAGDEEDADTLERAYEWHRALAIQGGAL